MTHSLKACSPEIKVPGREESGPDASRHWSHPLESGPLLFLLCSGWQAASGKPSGFHPGGGWFPFHRSESQTISTPHTWPLFVSFRIQGAVTAALKTVALGAGTLTQSRQGASPLRLEQRGWPEEMEGSKGFCQSWSCHPRPRKHWDLGPQPPPFLETLASLEQTTQSVYQHGRWLPSTSSGRGGKNPGSMWTCQESLGSSTDVGNASRMKKHHEPELPTELQRRSLSLLLSIMGLYAEDWSGRGL